jgi:hypothetical protein
MTDFNELIRCATLAPNGHNAQAWKFSVQGDEIHLQADADRRLAVVDPQDRELTISLGAALENLIIAARQAGNDPTVDPRLDPSGALAVRVALAPITAPASADPLYPAIFTRQTTRSLYDDRAVPAEDQARLQQTPTETGVSLHFYATAEAMEPLVGWVMQGDRAQYADTAFVDELLHWLRFNDAEALRTRDGLFSKCSGNPTAPRWLGQLFVRAAGPDGMAKEDEKKCRSSAGMVVIATAADDAPAWLAAGRTLERLLLTAETLNLKTAFMNQPIETPDLRAELQKSIEASLPAGSRAYPQLLVRYGYAAKMPAALRRPVDALLV